MRWQTTELWQRLEKEPEDSSVRRAVLSVLELAEPILEGGGTTPLTFTLHDAAHGYRVAKRIWELMPDSAREKMGSFELALLLLAAYLHDIGMSPAHDTLRAYATVLENGRSDEIPEENRQQLLHFMDVDFPGIELPVTNSELRSHVLAYWCRHEHNHWSESWIRKAVKPDGPQLYPRWVEDLVRLCCSHHEGLAALRRDAFDARIKGRSGQVVNLRYLAALLRVADVLELDPERTPEVLVHHRHIGSQSLPYWQKDHYIVLTLEINSRTIRLSSEPPTAVLYKAIVETKEQIDAELDICATLEDEGAFTTGKIGSAGGYHLWPWPRKLTADLKEGGDFSFINGAFRPHPMRVIELLADVALYDDPLVAVRELLQNAIDAVHEQTAYERLADSDQREDQRYLQSLSDRRKIWLGVETDQNGRIWIVCRDNGCGMTRAIIENSLLVTGSPRRPDVRALERRCERAGFELTRIGRFGIGCLSYFMLADSIEIRTRRSEFAGGDREHTGWSFVLQGLDDFGELRRDFNAVPGSEVRLRLKSRFVDHGVAEFISKLVDYVQATFRRLPCRFELTGPEGTKHINLDHSSWVEQQNDLIRWFRHLHLLSLDHNVPDVETVDEWRHVNERAHESFRCFGPIEDEDRVLGIRCRVFVPYWLIKDNPSLLYFEISGDEIIPLQGAQFFSPAEIPSRLSYNGIRSGIRSDKTIIEGLHDLEMRHRSVFVDTDLFKNVSVNLDRSALFLDAADLRKCAVFVDRVVRHAKKQFLQKTRNSCWHFFNTAVTDQKNDKRTAAGQAAVLWEKGKIIVEDWKWPVYHRGDSAVFVGWSSRWSSPSTIAGRALRLLVAGPYPLPDGGMLRQGGRLGLVCRNNDILNRRPIDVGRVWLSDTDLKSQSLKNAILYPKQFADLLLVGADALQRNDRRGGSLTSLINSRHWLLDGLETQLDLSWNRSDVATGARRALSGRAHARSWLLWIAGSWRREELFDDIRKLEERLKQAVLKDVFSVALDTKSINQSHRLRIWDKKTFVLSSDGLLQSKKDPIAADGLHFPDGTLLNWPEDPEWWVVSAGDEFAHSGDLERSFRSIVNEGDDR